MLNRKPITFLFRVKTCLRIICMKSIVWRSYSASIKKGLLRKLRIHLLTVGASRRRFIHDIERTIKQL